MTPILFPGQRTPLYFLIVFRYLNGPLRSYALSLN